VPDVLDTTVASHVEGRHAGLLRACFDRGRTISLPAPAIQEVTRGLRLRATRDDRFVRRAIRFHALLDHPLVKVVAFDRYGAVLAGRLLAVLPHPPTGGHRRSGTRAQQRAAWALDIQIAACAFAGGYGVLTENVRDFAVLRDAIADLAPGLPPLAVTDARASADAPA
jgi:predicted nucleic acid-binding protein